MLRITICSIALLGFGAAAQAGELDREGAAKSPTTKSSFGGNTISLAPTTAPAPAPATTTGSELDKESPTDAYHYRGYYGGYRGYYGGYRGYYGGWGYRGWGYGGWGYRGWGYRPYYGGWYGGYRPYYGGFSVGISTGYGYGSYYSAYSPIGFSSYYGNPWCW